MLSSPRNSLIHNEQAKLAINYNELLKDLSSNEMASVGCYTLGETIGQGTYGKVKKGIHKLTGKVVAIKKISKKHAPIMVREIYHHKQLKHPNIIMLYEMISTETSIHMISEYASKGDMFDALAESGGRCTEDRVLKWFHQMTDAIGYCHTRGIVHRDLKLENILLDKDDNVKICDFGFARFTQRNQLLDTFCGSLCNSAPEIILRKKYTGPETDIWSLGVILYTLISGEYPFDDDSEINTQRSIVQVDYQIPSYFSSDLSHLIDSILQFEPLARISIDEIKAHPWFCQTEGQCFKPIQSSNSDFRDIKTNVIAWSSTDIRGDFIHTKSNPVLSKENEYLSNGNIKGSLHFSMPALNYRSATKNSLFRSSLPSKLPSNQNDLANNGSMVTLNNMSPCEKLLLNALDTAGFDKGTLIKMQTGECDTSRTLWHLLLENMNNDTRIISDTDLINSVANNFASAVENHHQKENNIMGHLNDINCSYRNKSSSNKNTIHKEKSSNMTCINQSVKPYPTPVVPTSANIQTVGFGSYKVRPEKSNWISSIKSWFSASNKQQQQHIEKQYKHQGDTFKSSTSLDKSNFFTSCHSSNLKINLQKMNTPDLAPMSPPIYKSGSQKYRRHEIQLSSPPADEVDQLCYSMTSSPINLIQNKKYFSESIQRTNENKLQYGMPSPPPPTAECFLSTRADSLSLLIYTQPMEMDICEKQYSMYRNQQPTPPPSPPVTELNKSLNLSTSLIENKNITCIEPEHIETRNVPDPIPSTIEKNINIFKLNSPTRPRLALYGLQNQNQIQTKIIIEEEEEGEDD